MVGNAPASGTLLQATNADGEPEHEIIVADMPATGHTLGLTRLPRILLDALPDGPIPRAMREAQAYLNDPAKALAWVVPLPELLPITESLELCEWSEASGGPLREALSATLGLWMDPA